MTLLALENIPQLQAEVRALAAERDAVILAHNYQVPEVQDVADFVGDSLGLSQQAAATEADVDRRSAACTSWPRRRRSCARRRRCCIPDADAGCSLADSITADQLRAWKADAPRRDRRDVRQHDGRGQGRDRLLRDLVQRRAVVEHIYREHGEDTEILFGPDMFLGAYVEKTTGRTMHVWDGECHVHAGIRPRDITAMRDAHPGADFLIHPECGCSTSVMEYVAAGDVVADGVHMLSTGGMLGYAQDRGAGQRRRSWRPRRGCCTRCARRAPDVDFVAANEAASCRYMKMITLPKLRDALRDDAPVVKVPEAIAERARLPIERMVAIG